MANAWMDRSPMPASQPEWDALGRRWFVYTLAVFEEKSRKRIASSFFEAYGSTAPVASCGLIQWSKRPRLFKLSF